MLQDMDEKYSYIEPDKYLATVGILVVEVINHVSWNSFDIPKISFQQQNADVQSSSMNCLFLFKGKMIM